MATGGSVSRIGRAESGSRDPSVAPDRFLAGELRVEATGAVSRAGTTPEQWTPGDGPAVDRAGSRATAEAERRAPGRGTVADRAGSRAGTPSEPPAVEVEGEALRVQLERALGAAAAGRAETRLRDASKAFAAERFDEASRLLRPLVDRAPGVPAVRELYGLTLYRLGRWRAATRELEAFRALTGSTEQHPVLADCYRAMERWDLVDELWAELRAVSPSAELVTEGRIVAAGALADRGELPAAIRLLGQGFRFPGRPRVHHLRRAYALADLYERAGDIPHARDLFDRIAVADPGFVDAAARARSLA